MRNRIFLSETKKLVVLTIALCGALCVPSATNAQFNKLKDKLKKVVTTDSNQTPPDVSNNSGTQDRDVVETIDDAYVFMCRKSRVSTRGLTASSK